jgi:hypothetical protein
VLVDALMQHTAQCGLFRDTASSEEPKQSRLVPVAHKGLLGRKLRGMGRLAGLNRI